MAGLLLATTITASEVTIVGPALPSAIADLGGVERYSWVYAAYLLGGAAMVPVYGRLADTFGRRPILLWGILTTIFASVLSSLSPSVEVLIGFRALQGLGVGAVLPVAVTISGDLYPAAERPRVQSWFSVVWGVMALTGPAISALLIEYVSWRGVFYASMLPGLIAAVLIWRHYRDPPDREPRPIDVPGALLLVGSAVALLLGMQTDPMASGPIWTVRRALLLGGGVAGLVSFVFWQRQSSNPLIDPTVIANPVIRIGCLAGLVSGTVHYNLMTFVPMTVQGVLGRAPFWTGAVVVCATLGWTIATLVAARTIPRLGFPVHVRLAAVTLLVGTGIVLAPGPDTSLVRLVVGMLCAGAGMGTLHVSTIVAIQNEVPWGQRALGTSALPFFRTMGGVIGVGLAGAAVNTALRDTLAGVDDAVRALGMAPLEAVRTLLDPKRRTTLPEPTRTDVAAALGEALEPLFIGLVVLAVAAILIAWRWPARDPRRGVEG